MNASVTVYPARAVRTMDPTLPTAQAVAVRGDRVRAVGSVEELMSYPGARLDDRHRDDVLFPGFVEAHTHPFSGTLWSWPYLGYYTKTAPDGTRWEGCTTLDAVLDRLRRIDAALPAGEPLFAWGVDPTFFTGERLNRHHLDRVSATRPIGLMHQTGHLMTVNSEVLRRDGITRDLAVRGIERDADGEPTGELREPTAISLVASTPSMLSLQSQGFDAAGMRNFGLDARNHGTTTVTDLGCPWLGDDAFVASYAAQVEAADFPARISTFLLGGMVGPASEDPAGAARQVAALRSRNSAKLRFGHVKLVLDGSIQGYTARLQEPGYLADDRVGSWVVPPETFREAFGHYHRAGLTVHTHCNGDEATELFLETVEAALEDHPRWNHRHTVTHSQLSTTAQYRRMATLGMCANLFSNHLWYWGDQHRDVVLGPDLARRMNAAATALRCGVPITMHSDAPITPIDPLATASYAASRVTPQGRMLGENERITVPQALEGMTLGAAYTLKMDHEVGSIESGKFADFAVLDRDPWLAEAEELREVEVRGTVLGGRHFPVGG